MNQGRAQELAALIVAAVHDIERARVRSTRLDHVQSSSSDREAADAAHRDAVQRFARHLGELERLAAASTSERIRP